MESLIKTSDSDYTNLFPQFKYDSHYNQSWFCQLYYTVFNGRVAREENERIKKDI